PAVARPPARARGGGPPPGEGARLVRPGPGRHRHGDRGQLLGAERPELEVRAERDREARARLEGDDALAVALAPPHLAAPGEHVPDLLDGAVRDGARDAPRAAGEVRGAPAREPGQDA